MGTQNFHGLALLLGLGWFLLIYLLLASKRSPFKTRQDSDRSRSWSAPSKIHDMTDVAQQLTAVMAAPFQKQRLLNFSEYKVFTIVEALVIEAKRGYRVFAQTSLGEILTSPDKDAFRSINSKRIDILIVDQAGWPVLAIEYQGEGHYQGMAAARDAVKKEALRKAGIRYLEITHDDDAEQIRARVRQQLGWRTAAPTI